MRERALTGPAAIAPPAGTPKTYSGPVIDGRIAVDPLDAYRSGRVTPIPMMVGAKSDGTR